MLSATSSENNDTARIDLDSHEPENGCLRIYDTNDRQTVAFTDHRLDRLRELIEDYKRSPPTLSGCLPHTRMIVPRIEASQPSSQLGPLILRQPKS